MLAPVVHILPLTTLRRERLLPVPGRVIARYEQKVTSLDVVAEAHFGQEHLLVDVARMLGIRPEAAQRLIQIKAGDMVSKGQEIARRNQLFPVIVRAPGDGRVILVGSGRILMEVGDGTFELHAGLPGKITRQITERGVEITYNGALIQGVWGNGQLGLGVMMPLINDPNDQLFPKQIDVSLRGSILLAGHCSDPLVLKVASELPVRGMILGSLSPNLVSLAKKVDYPIIVVDGFGRRPMDSAAYNLLTTNAKREVTLNAEQFDRLAGVRPEILIPLPVAMDQPIPREFESFAPDQVVRLVRAPNAGAVGTLVGILPGLTNIPSGLRVAAGEVQLDSGDKVIVPLANLEVLG